MTKVSIILTTCRDRVFAERCLKSLRQSEGNNNFEIIVVDDDPSEPPIPDVIFINPKIYNGSDDIGPLTDGYNSYWVRPSEAKEKWGLWMAREIGYRTATGDFVVNCDSDVVVPKNWWVEFKKVFDADPDIQAVGPRIFPAWNQWAQYLPHEDTIKKLGASKDLVPEDLDEFNLKIIKYQPEWWEIDYIPDVHNITKNSVNYGHGSDNDRTGDWALLDIIKWHHIADAFVCFKKDTLYKLRKEYAPEGALGLPYPNYTKIFDEYGKKVVVSNRVAIWCGRQTPTTTTAPYEGSGNQWRYVKK